MAISYQSKDSAVQTTQLKVQEVCVKLTDSDFVSVSANDVTIDLKEPIGEVRLATFFDDSAGTNAPVVASNQAISGNTVKLSVGAAFAAADSITLKYVIAENV
jgi:hypothetical protein